MSPDELTELEVQLRGLLAIADAAVNAVQCGSLEPLTQGVDGLRYCRDEGRAGVARALAQLREQRDP
jgi:hypothetical protein